MASLTLWMPSVEPILLGPESSTTSSAHVSALQDKTIPAAMRCDETGSIENQF